MGEGNESQGSNILIYFYDRLFEPLPAGSDQENNNRLLGGYCYGITFQPLYECALAWQGLPLIRVQVKLVRPVLEVLQAGGR
jgi:hypothetical protein